jgi:GAF domain-containing protein
MAESIFIPTKADKKTIYEALAPQIEAILSTENDLTANLANFSAILKEAFGFFLGGFLLGKKRGVGLSSFSRDIGLYAYCQREGCLWYSLAGTKNYRSA